MHGSTNLEDKFVGSMVGSALGDAIGEIAFRCQERDSLLSAVEQDEELVYTDDTAMAVGLAESLVAVGELDQEHLGGTFRANYRREPWRGYASGPPTVFACVEQQGMSYAQAAATLYGGEGSYGNGAAMRIAPLGLLFHDAPDLYERAHGSARVTHGHPIGIDGAAVQARAVAEAVCLDPDKSFPAEAFLRKLLETARTSEMKAKLVEAREAIREDLSPAEPMQAFGHGVAVHDSLPFAIYAFTCYPHSFEDCLLCAVINGGDRDTLGAMACAISGAFLGIRAIPQKWRQRLENRDLIERLAKDLVALWRDGMSEEAALRED